MRGAKLHNRRMDRRAARSHTLVHQVDSMWLAIDGVVLHDDDGADEAHGPSSMFGITSK